MKNIELKINIDNNFNEILKVLGEIKAENKGELKQIDTYFNYKNARLKLREINNKDFEIIYYQRPDVLGSKISSYYRKNISKKAELFIKSILDLILHIKVRVEKERRLWIYKNTRIHLDKVKDLGNFLELETLVKGTMEDAEKEHDEVKEKLNLFKYKKYDKSYSDMLLESRHLGLVGITKKKASVYSG